MEVQMIRKLKKERLTFISVFILWGLFTVWIPAADALEHLRVGHLPVTGHAKVFVAKEQGFFAKEGIDAELILFINSADGINAIRAGKVDIGSFATTAPLVHIANGADLRIIGGMMGEDASVITRPERAGTLKTVADLRGKKVATVRLSTGDAVFRGALFREGINWKTDLQIFELKNPPAVIEAVKSGQVDAGVIWGPFDLLAEKEGLKNVIRSRALSPGHPCCRIVLMAPTLNQKRDTFVKYLRAILRAEKFSRNPKNKSATVDAIAKYVKIDKALIEKAYYHGYLDQSSDPNVKAVKDFWITMQKSEFIKSQQNIVSFIDTTLYKAALDSLAKENPKDPYWKNLKKVFVKRNV